MPNLRNGSKGGFEPELTRLRVRHSTTELPRSILDESMIKFKGRLQFRQYLPSKPIKCGIKVWALAERSTGYLSRCQIYTGKEGGRQENGLSHRVVMDLVRYLSGSHATIFMDNFYTSVKLLQDLLAIGLHGCGTVRANRKGLPMTLLPKIIKL